MRTSNRPLVALAKEADALEFPIDARDLFGKNAFSSRKGWCYINRANRIEVRLTLNNTQYIVGVFRGCGPEVERRASRFSDMVIQHFWGLRKRRVSRDGDYNNSESLAVSDQEQVPGAKQLLLKIRAALIDEGAFSFGEERKPVEPILAVDAHLMNLRREWLIFIRMAKYRIEAVGKQKAEKKFAADDALATLVDFERKLAVLLTV